MKKQLIFTFIFAVLAISVWAQPGKNRPTTEEKMKRVTSTIESELDLDSEKMAQVSKIYEDFFVEMEEEFASQREAMKEKRTEMIKARNSELQKVLSKEEYDELVALMETMRSKRQGRGKGPHGRNR